MDWFWIAQIGLNLLGLTALVLLWLERRAAQNIRQQQMTEDWLNLLEEKVRELDRLSAQLLRKADSSLALVENTVERAKEVLTTQTELKESFPPSQEEIELRELRNNPAVTSADLLPTVQQLEATKGLIRKDFTSDLRSVLQGQIA